MHQTFEPSREAGQARLTAFVPSAGRAYADDRNYDHGPARRGNVSALSPWLSHRLVTEREVVAAVLEWHSAQSAEKFIQEVFWRTYWKGWLQMRPGVWHRYREGVRAQQELAERNGGLRSDLRAALEGRTGIAGFDDWAVELAETGYLHNHARMWFASIWIFTLRLPWELGADLFQRHLLDGDAASNTLSWRWVAGLQTKGKTYVATRDNIAKYTGGRFAPDNLARSAQALDEPPPEAPRPIPAMSSRHTGPCAVLLTTEDLGVETLAIDWPNVKAVAIADMTADRASAGVSDAVAAFARSAAQDTLRRVRALAPEARVLEQPMVRLTDGDLLPWIETLQTRTLVVPETPVGAAADSLSQVVPKLGGSGVDIVRIRRSWDGAAWPHASKGFFPFKEAIPDLLRREGLP